MFKLLKKVIFAIAYIGVIMNGNCSVTTGMKNILFEFEGGAQQSYTTVKSVSDARDFVSDCIDAKKVYINGTEEKITLMDTSMKTLLLNMVNPVYINYDDIITQTIMLSDDLKAKLAMLTWVGYHDFSSVSPDTSGICLTLLNRIASSNYAKARWLLRSQCIDFNYTPLSNADWSVIGNAIHLLKNEKNGHTTEALVLLSSLKVSGNYEALLGK